MTSTSSTDSPKDIERYFDRLWPLMRSLTGDGVRKTHDILAELLPLERIEVPTGTAVLDWSIPKEWVCRSAYVVTPDGRRILDIQQNNLHVVNYSIAFRGHLTLDELQQHLHSDPNQPNAIPYVTSYYRPYWGFCLSEEMRLSLVPGQYEVVVDTDHIDGSLTLSHAVLPGTSEREVLISTYTCHPSLANNELSGPLVAAFLYRRLAALPSRRLTYRFVFVPETIGSIAYLARYGDLMRQRVEAGFVLTCIGDPAPFSLMHSRRSDTVTDRAASLVLRNRTGGKFRELSFNPCGSDERQYCSPGFNLPVCVLARSMYGTFSQYHTSLDNRDFVSFDSMMESVDTCFAICTALDDNRRYRRLSPDGEPQLGKRGLYPSVGGAQSLDVQIQALLWFLNLADGDHDLLDIAQRSGLDFGLLRDAGLKCLDAGLVELL